MINVEIAFETLVKNIATNKKSTKIEEKKDTPKKKGLLSWFK